MEKLRFTFAVLAASDSKSNIICITSIETPDGHVFDIPDDLKPASKHTAITTTDIFTKIKNSLKKRHQSRKIWIPLSQDLRTIYLDDGDNVQFGDQYLNEITQESKLSDNNTEIGNENKNLGKLAERFLLEKFSGKTSNVNQWIREFESECLRFDIIKDAEKIETLKHLLECRCLDWYTSMLIKFSINAGWDTWKTNFCETYGNPGWSQIKYAFTFKFQGGSLLDYATKKERLLLEINKEIDTQTLINLIVMGLPDYIMFKMNRESITSTANLFNEIGKHEQTVNKNNYNKFKRNILENKVNSDKIKPCKLCEKLNKGTRFHLEEKCWFKQQTDNHENRRHYSKNVNNNILDVELNDNEPKNDY
ncbi:uncharacterized protein LOC128198849 [Bicyclus anynana]|uniref:Uncharacterized protein LOC128198849 n=1 Tax=Bicyclus anynana TaxID=110368 RepID=A0ABM3LSV2_BICAN|nr:uncharacterized protein LOC128198849 [Bicyclus anynana]